MSYEKAKRIVLDEKNNRIAMTATANNVVPADWWAGEVYSGLPTFKEKVLALLCDVSGGNIHPNRSLYRFLYAFKKAEKELGERFWTVCHPDLPIYYDREIGHPHWNYEGEEYALTADQIASGEYVICKCYGEDGRYNKISELQIAEQNKAEKSERFYSLFMRYYNEPEADGVFYIELNGRPIRPVSEYRYRLGYSAEYIKNHEDLKRKWTMPYKKAFVLACVFGANPVRMD